MSLAEGIKNRFKRLAGRPANAREAFETLIETTEEIELARREMRLVRRSAKKAHDRAGMYLTGLENKWDPSLALKIGRRNAAFKSGDFSEAEKLDKEIKDLALSS